MASKHEASALLVDTNSGSHGSGASKSASMKRGGYSWTAVVVASLVIAGICADEATRFAVRAMAGGKRDEHVAFQAAMSPNAANDDPAVAMERVVDTALTWDTADDELASRQPVKLPPDFGVALGDDDLSDAIEAALVEAGVRTPDSENPTLQKLVVDYAGVKIEGNVYETAFDGPWLERAPLVEWGDLMRGASDGTKFTVAVFDIDADDGVLGVTNKSHTFLQALWMDCEGGSNIVCGAPDNSRGAPYVPPSPPSEDAPHKIVFLLFKQTPRDDGARGDGVKFTLHGQQMYHRNDRIRELLNTNSHLQPVAVTYMLVSGKNMAA
jgi:hypothetical protein